MPDLEGKILLLETYHGTPPQIASHLKKESIRNLVDGEAAQEGMGNAYLALQRETGCEVAPVGENWWKYHREHPETELYAEDGQHALEAGSRLAAATIAEVYLETEKEKQKRGKWGKAFLDNI